LGRHDRLAERELLFDEGQVVLTAATKTQFRPDIQSPSTGVAAEDMFFRSRCSQMQSLSELWPIGKAQKGQADLLAELPVPGGGGTGHRRSSRHSQNESPRPHEGGIPWRTWSFPHHSVQR